jgi:ubiquinone/menaquinone biosynthesis C-methylase UbiE
MEKPEPLKTLNDSIRCYLAHKPLFYSLIKPREVLLFQAHAAVIRHRILDFGCGDGFFTQITFGKDLIDAGLDIPGSRLSEAEKHSGYKTIVSYDGLHIPFPDNTFQTIITNSVLEHVQDLSSSLRELHRVLSPGGYVLATVMTGNWNTYLIGAKILGKWYQTFLKRLQQHHYLLSFEEWSASFADAGFNIVETTGYLSKKTARFLELFHYLSIPSLVTHALSGKWVLFPGFLAGEKSSAAIARLIDYPVAPEQSAALCFLLKK